MFPVDRAAFPVLLGLAAPFGAGLWLSWPWLWGTGAVLAAAVVFFFRDPDRLPPAEPGSIMSPADGLVVKTSESEGARPEVAIFLSLFDAHVNRVPCDGVVESVATLAGSHRHAERDAASHNAGKEVVLRMGSEQIVTRQLVGMLARRVVCRLSPGSAKAGEDVREVIATRSLGQAVLVAAATICFSLAGCQKVSGTRSPSYLQAPADPSEVVREVTPEVLRSWMASGAAVNLIDVREDQEWFDGHAEAALHISRWALSRNIGTTLPDKNSRIVLYCRSGVRSRGAVQTIQTLGYLNVYSLAGGFLNYERCGLPIRK